MCVHRMAFRQAPERGNRQQACMCIALRSASPRSVHPSVHIKHACASHCVRRGRQGMWVATSTSAPRWRAKYAARRGAARVLIPAQTQRTQTQGASTRSACVHRAIPHIASSTIASWRWWSARRARARCATAQDASVQAWPRWVSAHRAWARARRAASGVRSRHRGRSGVFDDRAARTHRTHSKGTRAGAGRAHAGGAGHAQGAVAAAQRPSAARARRARGRPRRLTRRTLASGRSASAAQPHAPKPARQGSAPPQRAPDGRTAHRRPRQRRRRPRLHGHLFSSPFWVELSLSLSQTGEQPSLSSGWSDAPSV